MKRSAIIRMTKTMIKFYNTLTGIVIWGLCFGILSTEMSYAKSNWVLVRTEYDDNNDGVIDRSEKCSYNADGDMNRKEIDQNNDGIIDMVETFEYSGDDYRIRSLDKENDGVIDEVEIIANSASTDMQDLDNYTLLSIYVHDSDGRVIREERDENSDGVFDKAFNFYYNDLDQKIRTEIDNGIDGIIDSVETVIYDNYGARIGIETDSNNDGKIDSTVNFIYASGQLKIRIQDNNNDNTNVFAEIYIYDDYKLVRKERDNRFDGSIESVEYYTWENISSSNEDERAACFVSCLTNR